MTRAVQRAIDLLEVLRSAGRPLPLTELAAGAGLDKATTMRLAKDLADRQLIQLNERTRTYSLGWRLADLAGGLWNQESLPQVALRHLEELRDRSLQTVELCSRVGDRYVVTLELTGLQPIKYARGIGTSGPLTEGAAGRAILAYDQPKVPSTYPDPADDSLRSVLDRIRLTGFVYYEEDDGSGSASIAAPIIGPTGVAEASICLLWVGTTARTEPWDRYRMLVMACARRISRLRGGSPTSESFTA